MPPATRLFAFLLVFTVLFLLALIATVAAEFTDVKWVATIVRITEGLGRLTLVSIAIAFISVEGIPMLAAWLKREMVREAEEKGRVEGHAEGLEEGRIEGREEGRVEGREVGRMEEREAWQDWTSRMREWEYRRAEADRAGEAFNEPPPRSEGSLRWEWDSSLRSE